MNELDRRMTSAMSWGVEAEMLTPAQVKELVPFINEEVIMGGFYCPTVSVVDSLETGTVMRKKALDKGALKVFANTEVLDVETEEVENSRSNIKEVRAMDEVILFQSLPLHHKNTVFAMLCCGASWLQRHVFETEMIGMKSVIRQQNHMGIFPRQLDQATQHHIVVPVTHGHNVTVEDVVLIAHPVELRWVITHETV